jgi:selenocysteine-specific elongation factor
MKGFGTVVTGTLVSGAVKPEDEAELLPARRRVRVRGVHSGGKAIERAVAGQRTGVNLAGVELSEVQRGMVLASPGLFEPTERLDARLLLLHSAPLLKSRARVHFHQGTAETLAEVILLGRSELAPGDSAYAQLRLAHPVLLLPGDRFILRRFSPVVTIGGGVVLQNLVARHRRVNSGESEVMRLLETLERGSREEVLGAMVASHPDGLDLAQIVARTGWLETEVREIAAKLEQAAKLCVLEDSAEGRLVLASAEAVARCVHNLRQQIESFHQGNPLLEGISKEELRERVAGGRHGARPELYRAALEQLLAAREVVVAGDIVKRAGREIALLPEEARAKEQIEQEFARAGLTVPKVAEVLAKLPVESKRAQKILQILLREQVVVKVAEDLVFHHAALAGLRELLAAYKREKGNRLPIAAFKELTGISRKYAIPLLEYLDRERLTRRLGDERIIL